MRTSLFFKVLWCCLVGFCLAGFSYADDRGLKVNPGESSRGQPEQRVALVIGNGAYEAAPLQNPPNDARTMRAVLRELGFEVAEKENLTQKDMKKVTQPIIITGSRIGVLRNAKLIPTARASILVAIASTRSTE